MKMITLVLMLFPVFCTFSQEDDQDFILEVSTDTILFGNSFEVRFTAKDINGSYESPKFEGFDIIGGPNRSTSMQIVNGISSQSSSYSYFLRPVEPGVHTILPAYFVSENKTWETSPREIFCLPNPEGVTRESRLSSGSHQDFPSLFGERKQVVKPPKKKLKVTKI